MPAIPPYVISDIVYNSFATRDLTCSYIVGWWGLHNVYRIYLELLSHFPSSFIAGEVAAFIMGYVDKWNDYGEIFIPCKSGWKAEHVKSEIKRMFDVSDNEVSTGCGSLRRNYVHTILNSWHWPVHIVICIVPNDLAKLDTRSYRYWAMLEVVKNFDLDQAKCIIDEIGYGTCTALALCQYERAVEDTKRKFKFTKLWYGKYLSVCRDTRVMKNDYRKSFIPYYRRHRKECRRYHSRFAKYWNKLFYHRKECCRCNSRFASYWHKQFHCRRRWGCLFRTRRYWRVACEKSLKYMKATPRLNNNGNRTIPSLKCASLDVIVRRKSIARMYFETLSKIMCKLCAQGLFAKMQYK